MERIIREASRDIPVVEEADVCVVGGSCTGVFAAAAAARRGARVAIVENQGFFGGMTTAALIGVWHTTLDEELQKPVIGGLTTEFISRLEKRNAVQILPPNQSLAYLLNTEETKVELDRLIEEQAIRPFLHTRFVAPVSEDGTMTAAIIEDKTGRRAIKASCFIDATGDGDVIHRMGLPTRTLEDLQPPTTCMMLLGLNRVKEQNPGFSIGQAAFDAQYAGALTPGFLWSSAGLNGPDTTLVAGTRVSGADCADADALTRAEMEGRRQARAILDIVKNNFKGGDEVSLAALPAHIGVRETRHADCLYQLTEEDVLHGRQFPDAIANGSYRVDIHHSSKQGITFRYLSGREVYIEANGAKQEGRWRPEADTSPTFYQIPYRCLVPKGSNNVLVAGRLMDADRGAYGAVRVIVNCNQTGEAAGTAAWMAAKNQCSVADVDPDALRASLKDGGALIV